MKKILNALVICLLCLFAFASCKNNSDEPTPTPEQPEHIHEFGEWETEKYPTCTDDGISARYCSCGEKQEKPLPTPGHNEQTIPAVAETCTKSGLTEGTRCLACGTIIVVQEPIPPHGHNLSTAVEKDENCNVFDVTTCSYDCGYLDKAFIKVDHSFGDWEFVSEKDNTTSSCGVDKLYAHTCSACGNVEEKTEFAEGHKWIYYDYPTVVECKYMGCYDLLLKECERCGEKDIRSGEGHIESDWIVQTEATCTTDGLKYVKCLRGGDILKEEPILAPGHDWKDATCIDPKTCLTCGETDGEAKGHTPGAAATCTTAQTCTECPAVIIPALGHDWKDATCTEPKTCLICGAKDGNALGHNYVNDICDRCDEKLVLAAGLYDADNNLVASWDTLVNTYGMDVEKDYTFFNFDTLTSSPYYILTNNSKLSNGVKLVIDHGVTAIGDYAFYNCNSLTSVIIPDSVTTIDLCTFSSCDSLASVEIPDSVATIDWGAFQYCYDLTSVALGNSVTTIGQDAFVGCDSLKDITVNANNQHYKSIDGNLYTKDGKTLIQYAIGKSDSKFVIPDSVTTIGERAFGDCDSLNSVKIPDNMTTIGDYAFLWCVNLTSVEIPDSVTTIGVKAFSYCDSLKEITVDSNNQHYKSIDGNLYSKDGKTLIQYAIGKTNSEFVIPDSVTFIGEQSFETCDSLTSVVILDSVTTIGSEAFYNCNSLTSVVIPDSVTTIGDYAFYSCDSLASVVIPDSVITIGDYAFYYCDSLKSVVIGNSVTRIGDQAFCFCHSLTSITIGNGVTSIGDGAFRSCSLTSITIPDSVTSIGDSVFSWCTSLTDVYYTGSEEQWAAISISEGNSYLTDATIHYNYVREE